MTDKKIVSTLAFLINAGISYLIYYDRERHKKLNTAKAFFDGNKLIFVINNQKYTLSISKGDKNGD